MTAAVSTDRSILLKNSQRASIRAMLKSLLIFVVVIISLLSVFQYFIFYQCPTYDGCVSTALYCPQWEAPGWNPIWPPMETNEVGLSHSGLGFYIYFPPVHRTPLPPWRRGFRKIESNARLNQLIRLRCLDIHSLPSCCPRKAFEWWRWKNGEGLLSKMETDETKS